jgi:uncharacterized pyridoxamine 5'-phosphate oxidase family protein
MKTIKIFRRTQAMDKVLDFLKEAGTFFYATVDEQGNPRVRPYGFVMKHEDKLYFGMGQQKPSFRQTVAHPQFEIVAYVPAKMAWLRLAGTAVQDSSPATLEAALKVNPQLSAMYNEQTGNKLGNFYIKNATATFSSFSGGDEVVTF